MTDHATVTASRARARHSHVLDPPDGRR